MKKWLNYHHLYYFKIIATEGGIAKAAQKLRLGQPTLSTQLKQFEDILGIELFDRAKRRLTLTDSGNLVLGYANDIFKLGDELLDTLSDSHLSQKYRVQIGIVDTVPKTIGVGIYKFASKQREAFISYSSGSLDSLLKDLRAHQLDLVVSNLAPSVNEVKGLFSKLMSKLKVGIYGSKEFLGLKKNFPESLKDQKFIAPGAVTKLRQDIDHAFRLLEISVDYVAEIQDTAVQKLLATNGSGLIAIADDAAEELVNEKKLFYIGALPPVHEELWIIAADRRLQNPLAQSIIKNFTL